MILNYIWLQQKYDFAGNYDRSMARTVWEKTCQDRYPDMLCRAREAALKDVGTNNLADIKDKGPKECAVKYGMVWLTYG